MNSTILFLVASDPRTSPRPAEAIRIAAGIAAAKQVAVSVYLCGGAVLALSENPDELIDSDHYLRYLPLIGEAGRPIYVESGNPHLAEVRQTALPYREVNTEALARLATQIDCVARF